MSLEPFSTDPSEPTPSRWRSRIVLVLVAAVAMPVGAGVLYTHSPTEYSFLPPCMFNKLTGWHCPGCGGTRCVYCLMHGDWEQALAYNPLFVVLSPFLAYGCVTFAYTLWTGKVVPCPGWLSLWGARLLLGLIFVYWIIRNIDVYPFTLLAPHQI